MVEKKETIETGWNFDNSYAHLSEAFFTGVNPAPARAPKLVVFNNSLAESLGLNAEVLKRDDGIATFAGNKIPKGGRPIAQAYAGHQFGHFTMLGDGRAILLGEQITPQRERVDVQLKGSGRTPYSRGGDGRAALGPMLREYIISEAMHALRIATTRSLAVVTTGEPVIREKEQPGAILTRIAASHIRVGTFQYASKWCTVDELKALADYTIKRHFPDVDASKNRYLSLLQKVIKKQAALIAKWQLVGFIHGVMNTDNMAISGETIDYGPCAFMDTYDPATVFSSIDIQGRYAYGNQPHIAAWNIARLAETLLPIIHANHEDAVRLAQNEIANFTKLYHANWLEGMRAKLGLISEETEDEALINGLLTIMQKNRADYTNTFLSLTYDKSEGISILSNKELAEWYEQWQSRLERQKESKESIEKLMQKSNPVVIPRNHQVEEALEAAVKQEDYTVMERLLDVLTHPYTHPSEDAHYYTQPGPANCNYRTFCGT